MTLSEFLLARIDEDESVARRPTPDEYESGDAYMFWHEDATDEVQWHTAHCGLRMGEYNEACQCDVRARVIAECEAKRQVVTLFECHPGADPRRGDLWNEYAGMNAMLNALALPYADHPDFDDAWRV